MKVLLTGVAGTGKSTIVNALSEKGIVSLDLHDVPGLFFWQNKETKEKVEYTPVTSREWLDTVERLCDIPRLKDLLTHYKDIVAAGTTGDNDQEEFLSLFDRVILLQAMPETLLYRMQTRVTKSGYGRTKAEQEENIEWQKEFDERMLSYGAVPLSTEGDLGDTIDSVIAVIKPEVF